MTAVAMTKIESSSNLTTNRMRTLGMRTVNDCDL